MDHGQLSFTPHTSALTINVTITTSTEPPTLGQGYSLICTVTGADPSLNAVITYQWLRADPTSRENPIVTQVGGNYFTLNIDPLTLSDVGLYTCVATFSSSRLSEDITTTSETFELKFQGLPLR